MPDVVDQQTGGPVVVDHQDIRVAVIVHVSESNSAAHLGQGYDATAFLTHIFIPAISEVVEQQFLLLQGITVARPGLCFDGLDLAIRYENVQPSVVIIVDKANAEACVRHGDAPQAGLK